MTRSNNLIGPFDCHFRKRFPMFRRLNSIIAMEIRSYICAVAGTNSPQERINPRLRWIALFRSAAYVSLTDDCLALQRCFEKRSGELCWRVDSEPPLIERAMDGLLDGIGKSSVTLNWPFFCGFCEFLWLEILPLALCLQPSGESSNS